MDDVYSIRIGYIVCNSVLLRVCKYFANEQIAEDVSPPFALEKNNFRAFFFAVLSCKGKPCEAKNANTIGGLSGLLQECW